MKKKNFHLRNLSWLIGFAFLWLGVSCDDDETTTPPAADPIAAFQFAVDATNPLQVTLTNFSQNATSYLWELGDGNTSTDKDLVYTYTEFGAYTVKLTATNADGKTATRSESFTLADPNAQLRFLAGDDTKTWYLQRQDIALGIGPTIGSNEWWSFGGVTPLGDRPCILDDTYTFGQDGSFTFTSNGTIFIDAVANGGWKETEGCYDESDAATWEGGSDAFGDGGSYTYDYDAAVGTIDLLGEGAFIGLATKTNDADNVVPVSVKTYTIFHMAEGDVADSLHIALAKNDGSNAWNFYLVSYKNASDLPPIPSQVPTSSFSASTDGLTATFTNGSTNSTEYLWDFGDGNTSTEENPVHTYAAEGTYTVKLSSTGNGTTVESTQEVIVSAAVFTASVLSNADGKVWTLAGAGSYKVGPSPDSGEWWPGPGDGERLCVMDDEFKFTDGGGFAIDTQDESWAEAYMGAEADGCAAISTLPAPFNALGTGTDYTFEITDATDTDPAILKVTGVGAYVGFSKPSNSGEYNNDHTATTELVGEITYIVVGYVDSPEKEVLTVAVDYSADQDGTAYWTMTLESIK